MKVKSLRPKQLVYLRSHQLENKYNRQIKLLERNYRHPSLNTEILEPRYRKIYSFRIDRKYRAIFIVKNAEIVVIALTDHYS